MKSDSAHDAAQPVLRKITREFAALAVNSSYAALPDIVQREIPCAFMNWMGCVLGGRLFRAAISRPRTDETELHR